MAGKERPETKAAPRHQNHQKVAAPRLARLLDPDASRAEPGASLCLLCLCYPGNIIWPPPLYACGGSRQPESSVGTTVDLPGRRGSHCEERPSTVTPGRYEGKKTKGIGKCSRDSSPQRESRRRVKRRAGTTDGTLTIRYVPRCRVVPLVPHFFRLSLCWVRPAWAQLGEDGPILGRSWPWHVALVRPARHEVSVFLCADPSDRGAWAMKSHPRL
ncbi:hypothetical protein NDU88_004840 [Pleurodeles waltl]|uniref:Uncharacterized protein n=1 Tax=Pleurodeles waltl TaxID=8319 RepID=A0AAV7QD38_PLEWA|nr:hypothetical protein NDU88_004840 [Pleurodeles waltl]